MSDDPKLFISKFAGEACRFHEGDEICGRDSVYKVEEAIFADDPNPNRHPLTNYLCRAHFNMVMGGHVADCAGDELQTRDWQRLASVAGLRMGEAVRESVEMETLLLNLLATAHNFLDNEPMIREIHNIELFLRDKREKTDRGRRAEANRRAQKNKRGG